jgi:hypothetical protein
LLAIKLKNRYSTCIVKVQNCVPEVTKIFEFVLKVWRPWIVNELCFTNAIQLIGIQWGSSMCLHLMECLQLLGACLLGEQYLVTGNLMNGMKKTTNMFTVSTGTLSCTKFTLCSHNNIVTIQSNFDSVRYCFSHPCPNCTSKKF